MQKREWDELLVQRDTLRLRIILEINITLRSVRLNRVVTHLFCASPLWAVYGVKDRGPPRPAWTSSSPTRSWRHAHTNTQQIEDAIRTRRVLQVVCICGSTLPLIYMLYICMRPTATDTHPSRSISSVLKVKTWGRGHTFCKLCTQKKTYRGILIALFKV